ncbi:hypothetical protein GPALN_010646 [Globodera pallida]|nr:hypothetical protein GPALN_010646 [Globodera pallida]
MFTDFTQNLLPAGTHNFPNMSVTCFRTSLCGTLSCMSNNGANHGRDQLNKPVHGSLHVASRHTLVHVQ